MHALRRGNTFEVNDVSVPGFRTYALSGFDIGSSAPPLGASRSLPSLKKRQDEIKYVGEKSVFGKSSFFGYTRGFLFFGYTDYLGREATNLVLSEERGRTALELATRAGLDHSIDLDVVHAFDSVSDGAENGQTKSLLAYAKKVKRNLPRELEAGQDDPNPGTAETARSLNRGALIAEIPIPIWSDKTKNRELERMGKKIQVERAQSRILEGWLRAAAKSEMEKCFMSKVEEDVIAMITMLANNGGSWSVTDLYQEGTHGSYAYDKKYDQKTDAFGNNLRPSDANDRAKGGFADAIREGTAGTPRDLVAEMTFALLNGNMTMNEFGWKFRSSTSGATASNESIYNAIFNYTAERAAGMGAMAEDSNEIKPWINYFATRQQNKETLYSCFKAPGLFSPDPGKFQASLRVSDCDSDIFCWPGGGGVRPPY